jgi:AcrR family transcriptional regulator
VPAAIRVLGDNPDASLEDIAGAAGVTRPTVYAHYRSRLGLLEAAVAHATDEAVAAMQAARPDEGPAPEALIRVLDAEWDAVDRYPFLWTVRSQGVGADDDRELHGPVIEGLIGVVRRGQADGAFDPALSPDWLVAVLVAIAHAAGQEVGTGRMTVDGARSAIRHTVLNLLRVPPRSER